MQIENPETPVKQPTLKAQASNAPEPITSGTLAWRKTLAGRDKPDPPITIGPFRLVRYKPTASRYRQGV
jgi:hypothetical protein